MLSPVTYLSRWVEDDLAGLGSGSGWQCVWGAPSVAQVGEALVACAVEKTACDLEAGMWQQAGWGWACFQQWMRRQGS